MPYPTFIYFECGSIYSGKKILKVDRKIFDSDQNWFPFRSSFLPCHHHVQNSLSSLSLCLSVCLSVCLSLSLSLTHTPTHTHLLTTSKTSSFWDPNAHYSSLYFTKLIYLYSKIQVSGRHLDAIEGLVTMLGSVVIYDARVIIIPASYICGQSQLWPTYLPR